VRRRDWDKNRRQRPVRTPGGERTDTSRPSGVPPSDKQVRKLRDLGYTGKRPPTSAEANLLIREWTPRPLGVSLAAVIRLGDSPKATRSVRAAKLLREVKGRYAAESEWIRESSRMGEASKRKKLRILSEEFDEVERKLLKLARPK
jgi:hypothetical protein